MPRNENYFGKPLQLSTREIEVMRWAACGKTSSETSHLLSITQDTVNAHIKTACRKLDAANKTHAIAIAIVHGILRTGPLPEMVIPLPTLFGLSGHPSSSRAASGASSDVPQRPFVKKT